MIGRFADRFLRDSKGGAAVEFGLAAPVMLIAVMGVFDLGHNIYTSAVLQGQIQKAARDATIEGASTAEIDARVTNVVHAISPNATLTFDREAYINFKDVRQAEDFTDSNKNGTCDNGEPYFDANGNGKWDPDRGKISAGNARDAVLYQVEVTYKRLFPVATMIGQDDTFTMTSATVLRNQPYGLQSTAGMNGNCA